MDNKDVIERLRQNNKHGEELIKFIENELPALKAVAVQKYYQKQEVELRERNRQLKEYLEYWKNKVIELEIMNNIPQYSCSATTVQSSNIKKECQNAVLNANDGTDNAIESKVPSQSEAQDTQKKAPKKEKKKDLKPAKEEKSAADDKPVDVSRLDLRIGRILTAKKHPDAESLYIEEIDVGENKPRTVVSGLVKYVPLEEMQNRLVVVLCNLKPAKMRGVTSEAMVMCASTPEKVEILVPPSDSVPGDRVICSDFPGDPDSILPPKKKIFEQVAPDLKTNDNCIATYKSSPLVVMNKGEVKAPSLTNVQIK